MVRELLPNIKFTEKPWPDRWYFGREKKLVKDEDVDDEVNKVRVSDFKETCVFETKGGILGGRRSWSKMRRLMIN